MRCGGRGGAAAGRAGRSGGAGGPLSVSDEGITIELLLEPDGSFVQQLRSVDPLDTDDVGAPVTSIDLAGRWRVEGTTLRLFARPVRAPSIAQVAATRDPSVRLRVTIVEPDGRPARGLLIGEGADANPVSAPVRGVVAVPLGDRWSPGLRQVVRAGDGRRLAAFTVRPGGPNSFRFVYRPSEVEPFDLRGSIADARGAAVIVPFGIGGALLRRVAPQ